MHTSFLQLRRALEQRPPVRVSVACAQDEEMIQTVKAAHFLGFAEAILVGDRNRIQEIMEKKEFSTPLDIIHEPDEFKAALIASSIVRDKGADVLMKGLINTTLFLKAVLDEKSGLRNDRLLSHFSAFENQEHSRIMYYTDGGLNTFPNLQEKVQILRNGLEALHHIGIDTPKVAALAANEVVNPKMQSTLDARELERMALAGELPRCILEGPITIDVAFSKEAAKRKGIESKISGEVDLLLMPNIEAGNMVGKTLMFFAHAKMAGVVLGAQSPVVLASRAANAEEKLNSLALACLMS